MNKILLLVLCCIVMGCGYQTVNRYDLDEAEIICAKKGSHIIEISSSFAGHETVTCATNDIIPLHNETVSND